MFKKPTILPLIEKPNSFLFNSVFFWRLAIYVRRILSCFDRDYNSSSGVKTALRTAVISIDRNNYMEVFSTFPPSFRNRQRYFNTTYLTVFFWPKTLFMRCELYREAADQLYKQYEHFWPIQIKSKINWQTSLQIRILVERRASKTNILWKIRYSKLRENHMTRKHLRTVSAV